MGDEIGLDSHPSCELYFLSINEASPGWESGECQRSTRGREAVCPFGMRCKVEYALEYASLLLMTQVNCSRCSQEAEPGRELNGRTPRVTLEPSINRLPEHIHDPGFFALSLDMLFLSLGRVGKVRTKQTASCVNSRFVPGASPQ